MLLVFLQSRPVSRKYTEEWPTKMASDNNRIVSTTLGRPLSIEDDNIDTEWPSTWDDDHLETICSTSRNTITPGQPQNSPFLQLVRFRHIQGKIHRALYTNLRKRDLPLIDRVAIREDLHRELDNWKADIASLNLASGTSVVQVSSAFLHPSWYSALYNSALLLMFRPSSTFPYDGSRFGSPREENVLRTIWISSRSVVAGYADVLRSRKLNYSWICLYTIFMAGLANMYSVGLSAQRRKQGIPCFLPNYLDVMSDVRECSNVLSAICERWDDVRSSCEIFNRLSNAAIRELMAASFRPSDTPTKDLALEHDPQPASRHVYSKPGLDISSSSQLSNPRTEDSPSLDTSAVEQFPNSVPCSQSDRLTWRDQFAIPPDDDMLEFQQFFQNIQSSVHKSNHAGSNEVMLGFEQGWFDQIDTNSLGELQDLDHRYSSL